MRPPVALHSATAARTLGCLLALSAAASADAHHSQAARFDSSRRVEITGEVVEWRFRSPHSFLVVNGVAAIDGVPTEDGVQSWEIESSAAARLRLQGIDETTFRPGDRITVRGVPHRDPEIHQAYALGSIADAYFSEDGTPIGEPPPLHVATPVDAAGVAQLAGLWEPPLQPSGPSSPLALTEQGLAAWRGYDEALSPLNTCEPISIPDVFNAPRYLVAVEIGEGQAVVRNQLYNIVRTIPLDGTAATADATGRFGVVSGRVEGDSLVIESRDYPASAWGLAIATQFMGAGADVPSSDQKTVVERFSSSEDGLTLIYEYTLDDPVYLAEPFSHRVEMARLPEDTPVYPYDCDVESASRFSRD